MTALPHERLDKLVQRWEEIQAQLNSGAAPSAYVQLTKEYADLSPVVESIQALRRLEALKGKRSPFPPSRSRGRRARSAS